MASRTTSPACRLLQLPPEIRNIIYRYSLVKGRIRIDSHLQAPRQPTLLQLNRQIRKEAVEIYYTENEFKWYIRDFDGSTYCKWVASSKYRMMATSLWSFGGIPNWINILKWLELYYNKQAHGPATYTAKRPNGTEIAFARLFEIVKQMRRQRLSWMQVKANLELMHFALVAVDGQWDMVE